MDSPIILDFPEVWSVQANSGRDSEHRFLADSNKTMGPFVLCSLQSSLDQLRFCRGSESAHIATALQVQKCWALSARQRICLGRRGTSRCHYLHNKMVGETKLPLSKIIFVHSFFPHLFLYVDDMHCTFFQLNIRDCLETSYKQQKQGDAKVASFSPTQFLEED